MTDGQGTKWRRNIAENLWRRKESSRSLSHRLMSVLFYHAASILSSRQAIRQSPRRVHERYRLQTDRQTDDRQTEDDI